MNASPVELQQVTKRFGDRVVLQPTDLRLEEGRTTVLLGPSGCGKSTLLRLVLGLWLPDGGQVLFEGEPLTSNRFRDVRRRVGYVIQDGGLFPHLTGHGNATLMARHLGWSSDRCRERLMELAQLVHLAPELLEHYPGQLSGGQRQRVGLMRALFLDPPVLLLDEPMAALDPMIRSDLQKELRSIFNLLEKTVLLVTHDLGEAGFLGDRIVLMRDGRIAQAGSLADLVRRPAEPFVTEFLNAQRSPLESLEDDER